MSSEDLVAGWYEQPPSAEAWRAVREPLASLMPAEDFKVLNEHYRLLGVLLDPRERPRRSEQDYHERKLGVQGISSDLKDETPKLRSMLGRYANPPRRVRLFGF